MEQARDARDARDDRDDACPLCRATGLPVHGDSDSLPMICCDRCSEWYHAACILGSADADAVVPSAIRSHLDDMGSPHASTDWTGWVGHWYCGPCVAWSASQASTTVLESTVDPGTFPPHAAHDLEVKIEVEVEVKVNGLDPRPRRQAAANRPDYHAMHHHISTPTARWLDLVHDPEKYGTSISVGNFPRIPSSLLTRSWIEASPDDTTAFPPHLPPTLFYGPNREPLIIKPQDGGFEAIGGRLPPRNLTVADIARLVGPSRSIGVIDVATQSSVNWTLQQWADYMATKDQPGAEPKKTYNIISLEISGTDLGRMVRPPSLVAEIDWVDNYWDFGPGGKSAAVQEQDALLRAGGEDKDRDSGKAKKPRAPWPKVQMYCLMGSKGSWTDWHCDFAASSVYYTILKGIKQFFFIRPTAKNLAAYAEWTGSYEMQQDVWLGSMCDEVRSVTLHEGDTMIIPAGYIHSVYTPEDAIVFGGNFLHSYDIRTQLYLRQIEIDTKVPQMFRFPHLDKLCWYVAAKTCSHLCAIQSYRPRATAPRPPLPPQRVLHGLVVLAEFLAQQVAIMENPDEEDKKRKAVYDRIPDVVKNPYALALELKARAERALPAGAKDEEALAVAAGKKRRKNGTRTKAAVEGEKRRKTTAPATPTLASEQDKQMENGDIKPVSHPALNDNGPGLCVD